MLPTLGLMDHTTAAVPPWIVAVNCCVAEAPSVICAGLTLIDIGSDGLSVIEDCAVLDGSAKLAAVTRMVCKVLIAAGAV
jgi:hypothetical protein